LSALTATLVPRIDLLAKRLVGVEAAAADTGNGAAIDKADMIAFLKNLALFYNLAVVLWQLH
jgi:hypothetical protein